MLTKSSMGMIKDLPYKLLEQLLPNFGYNLKGTFGKEEFILESYDDLGIDADGVLYRYGGHTIDLPISVSINDSPSSANFSEVKLQSSEARDVISDSGLTSQQYHDIRNVQGLMSSGENVSSLHNRVLLQKLRSDYPEFCVYTPMSYDSKYWHRWLFTNRFNLGNSGATRMINCSLAALNPSKSINNFPSNNVDEITASNPVVTLSSSNGSTTGTWTTPDTILTTTDVSYSDTSGDTITYTLTGVNRIVIRGLMAGNGGIGKVTVSENSVEIPDLNYVIGNDRLISFLSSGLGNTTMHYPIASGLNSDSTYTITIEVDSTNPSGSRVYQAGILGYLDIPYNQIGYHGIFISSPLKGTSSNVALTSGTTVVYEITDTTKMYWDYIGTSVSGLCVFTVYDQSGSTVSSGVIDTSSSSISKLRSLIDIDLEKGTYYLHVTSTDSVGELSTGNRMYDVGVTSYDQTFSGELGVDEFDNFDVPNSISDPNNGSEYMLIGSGNLELAINVRKPSDEIQERDFVGGIHSHENAEPISVYVDDDLISYDNMSNLDTVIGSNIRIELSSELLFPSDNTPCIDVSYKFNFSQAGYCVETVKTTTAPCVIHNDFDIMFNCPNTESSSQGRSVGGGFEFIAGDKNYVINNYDNGGTFINTKQSSVAMTNNEYTALCYYNKPVDYPEEFRYGDYNKGNDYCLIQDRTDRTVKWYTRSFSGDETYGVEVPPGLSWTTSKIYRVIKGNLKGLVGF